MKTALVLMLSLSVAFTAFAQEQRAATSPDSGDRSEVVKKLGAVTWDLNSHKLI